MVSCIMKSLIIYCSYSGNTEEIAQYIEQFLTKNDVEVNVFDITYKPEIFPTDQYDIVFLGTFTWDYGSVPEEMEDFLSLNNLEHENIAFFGSGDTQFGGGHMYCKAVEELVARLHSRWEGLKIEQSPRGVQEKSILTWVERVFHDVKTINKSENVRASFSE